MLEQTCRDLDIEASFLPVITIDALRSTEAEGIPVIECGELNREEVQIGEISAACGGAAAAYIEKAIEAALNRSIDAIVTGPIHKKALVEAGYPFLGHTEMLADRRG